MIGVDKEKLKNVARALISGEWTLDPLVIPKKPNKFAEVKYLSEYKYIQQFIMLAG
ncbi:hypothetical protein [Bacillus sp. 22-7]|uniref:hypothetical protein n=1 Tax=Bacillus sp. 22-7 TaxID=2709707 RepID=UPI0013D73F56|nr:hypothetical protein [Bacillus sp. 22-7]